MARACLVKISPLDPATGSRVDIYLSNTNDAVNGPKVNGLNGQTWEPAIFAPPVLSMRTWNGDFVAAVEPGEARLGFSLAVAKRRWPQIDSYVWPGAAIEVYAEVPGAAWPWAVRFKGRVGEYSAQRRKLTLTAKVDESLFSRNVLTAIYAGTGGSEGGVDLKNKVKPLVLGWAQNVEPVLIDTVNSVYQFSGYGAIEAVSKVYERGSDFGSSSGDYATYDALIGATVPRGSWASCLASGMIRLGAPAYGVITGDIRGHRVGASTPRLTGAIIQAIATLAGVAGGDINATSLSALDTAKPYPISLFLDQQVQFLDIAPSLALACNHQAGITLAGKFFAAPVSLAPSEAVTLHAQGQALPQVIDTSEQKTSVPYYKTTLGAQRCWRVHSDDEIAFNAPFVPVGAYNAATTYREGNIASLPDGSNWLFIATTPSSGHAPPTWPVSSNAYWQNLDPPTAASWDLITGANRPADNATRNVTTYSPAAPASPVDGDLWVDTSGTFAVFKLRSGGAWVTGANALSAYTALTGKPVALADINTTESAKLTGIEASADVTLLVAPASKTERKSFTYDQIAKVGQFPFDIPFKLLLGAGSDVTASATWAATLKNGTASFTIGAATGILNITACTVDATIEVAATYNGKVRKGTAIVLRDADPAPASGGGGSGTSDSKALSASALGNTYGAAVGPMLTVKAGSSGQVSLTASAPFWKVTNGTVNAYGKWQWRVVGGTFADVAAETISGTPANRTGGSEPANDAGDLTVSVTKTGLVNGTSYEFQFLARSATSATIDLSGTETGVGS